jgi:hypothetical protein
MGLADGGDYQLANQPSRSELALTSRYEPAIISISIQVFLVKSDNQIVVV